MYFRARSLPRVQGYRWNGTLDGVPQWVEDAITLGYVEDADYIHIYTPRGRETCHVGDFLVLNGEDVSVMTKERFQASFESDDDVGEPVPGYGFAV